MRASLRWPTLASRSAMPSPLMMQLGRQHAHRYGSTLWASTEAPSRRGRANDGSRTASTCPDSRQPTSLSWYWVGRNVLGKIAHPIPAVGWAKGRRWMMPQRVSPVTPSRNGRWRIAQRLVGRAARADHLLMNSWHGHPCFNRVNARTLPGRDSPWTGKI